MDICRGIIPAYAGSTSVCLTKRIDSWDHPRIRGEHKESATRSRNTVGSSPHTRGARAGTRRTPANPGDHPRIRGEHGLLRVVQDRHHGSSPHTRGAPPQQQGSSAGTRNIPAYAGSTWIRSRSGSASGDHPRIRGEHLQCFLHLPEPGGSSPHTRGARFPGVAGDQERGIIPAYAGSTCEDGPRAAYLADHPRIRGEHPLEIDSLSTEKGSSPHTRGAHASI